MAMFEGRTEENDLFNSRSPIQNLITANLQRPINGGKRRIGPFHNWPISKSISLKIEYFRSFVNVAGFSFVEVNLCFRAFGNLFLPRPR